MLKTEECFKFTGLLIVAVGFIRMSIFENFNQGKNLLILGLVIQLIGFAIYIYNKKNK